MYKKILHATDLSSNHFDLCKQAVTFAKSFGADLHLVHVVETPSSLQWAQNLGFIELPPPAIEDAKTVMNVMGEALNIPADHLHVETGAAFRHILDKAKALNCDLVILGSHSNNGLRDYIGTTAHAVVHHACCDVLTFRVG